MSSYLHWPIIFCGFGLLFTAVELMRPARPLSYRAVIKNDLVALGIYGLLFLPVSIWLSRRLVKPDHVFLRSLLDLPLLVRLILYYVLADLGLYGVHRLMHSRHVWQTAALIFGSRRPSAVDESPFELGSRGAKALANLFCNAKSRRYRFCPGSANG